VPWLQRFVHPAPLRLVRDGGLLHRNMREELITVRVILMNGIESEALRFSHACARMNGALIIPLRRG
jgi:hypothetical protein